MDFYFENQGTNTYLVYAVKPEDTVDTLSLGMLTNNKILGLAQTQFMQMDADKFIKYNVSAHISVKQFFEGSVNKKRLIGVFKGIVNALLSAEDYMIDTNSIVIDLDYMFADVSTCETVLICWPIVGADHGQTDLGAFFKNIMFSTQFDQTDNCDYVAKIINYLNSAAKFSLAEFKDVLEGIDSVSTAKPSVQQKQPVVTKPATKETVAQQPTTQTVATPSSQTPAVNPQAKLPAQQPSGVGMKQNPATSAPKIQVPPTPARMAVPGQKPQSTTATPVAPNGGKEISWFYLMQHYNKENAAAYKAQKEAKKAAKGKPAAATQTPPKSAPQAPQPSVGYAIPGQDTQPKQPATQPAVVSAQPAVSAPQTGTPTAMPQQPAYVPREVPQGQSMNFGETTVLGGGGIGETTVLNASQAPAQMIAPHLIRKKNSEKISINKPVYRIGKERSYVDYFIGDNTAISRSHANIITRDGVYYIVDTNSTNHTFVNGTMIQSNVETAIAHGDTIRLANEDFEFKLY